MSSPAHHRLAVRNWRWPLLAALSLVAWLLVAVLARDAAQQAEARWQQTVQRSAAKPQQFLMNWLELRRQLLRSLALQSDGRGWSDELSFLVDLAAVAQDSDGEIELATLAARVDGSGRLVAIGSKGLQAQERAQLTQRGVPATLREVLLPPLPDGRVPLARPLGGDQWLFLLLDVPGLLQQLQSLDWPEGLQLQLQLRLSAGPAQSIWQTRQQPVRLRFSEQDQLLNGQWQFDWSATAHTLGGPDSRLAWTIGGLGSLLVLGAALAAASLLAQAQRLRAGNAELAALNRELDRRVAERTASLSAANQELQRAMRQLAESQKLAALGQLVAGVSHELNTPLGVVTTAATTLEAQAKELRQHFLQGQLKRTELAQTLQHLVEGSELVVHSAAKAAELVRHFKEIAVDQTSMRRRRFQLGHLLRALLQTLEPGLRRAHCGLEFQAQQEVELDSYPGALEQALTNVIQNALVHGLAGRHDGQLLVGYALADDQVTLWVSDNGVGMDASTRARYFEPFFTTRMGQGGSGLGGYLVYNLVVGLMGGQVQIDSTPGVGTRVAFRVPRQAPEQGDGAAVYRIPGSATRAQPSGQTGP